MRTILFVLITIICSSTCAKLYLDDNVKFPLDTDLYERVLDQKECQKQLEYIQQNNTLLLARFLDAGMRIPKGIFEGNLVDLGNYPQCLEIKESMEDMSIEGKYCMIKVPPNQNLKVVISSLNSNPNYDPIALRIHDKTMNELMVYETDMRKLRATFGNELKEESWGKESPLSLQFHLALCIPKVCTTRQVITELLFNVTEIGFEYEDNYCRLPNDKPWAPVDYLALEIMLDRNNFLNQELKFNNMLLSYFAFDGYIVIFSILGLLTILSTCYDVHYNIICKKDPEAINEIIVSFSAWTNCRRLLVMKPNNSDNINCLDGIRALAIFWVLIGHVFYITSYLPANPIFALQWTQSLESIWIMTASLTVDTFFLLSGLLLVYISAKKLTGRQLIRNLPFFYFNRLLRVFPVLAAVILYEASFSNRVADGPLWHRLMVNSAQKCRQFWWTTLLHLQNFINPEQICLGVTWYLAIDIQLHILSPIVLFWVLGRSKVSAWTALTTALFGTLVVASAYIFTCEPLQDRSNYFVYYYSNILTRAPPFFVGLLYGYMLHVWRGRKAKIHLVLHGFITAFFISLIMLIVYCKFVGDRRDFDNGILRNLFRSFLRPLWALSLGWIIFACVNGYAGPINWFLSLDIWKIPARISYAIYLIHMSLIMAVYSTKLQPVYFSVRSAMFDAFGFLWLTMFVAFFITALIDAPFAILFKKMFEYMSKKETNINGKITESHQNGSVLFKNEDSSTMM